MDKWKAVSLIFIVCYLFLMFAWLGLIPEYIINLFPSGFLGGFFIFSLIVVFLFNIVTLPFEIIFAYILDTATAGLSQSQVSVVRWIMLFFIIVILYYFYRKKKK